MKYTTLDEKRVTILRLREDNKLVGWYFVLGRYVCCVGNGMVCTIM